MSKDGMLMPVKMALSKYMTNWYSGLYASTPSLDEFVARGISRSIMYVPGRMLDDAEKMLELYRKASMGLTGANSLFPIVLIAMAKEWVPVAEAFGHQVGDRQMVALVDDPNASVYGYRQSMGEVRTQAAIFASDEPTAKALAAQLSLFIGAIGNRRFTANFTWGQYQLSMPVMVDSPQVSWLSVATGEPNLTVLAGDIQLNATFPFLDAPAPGEANDGTTNVPPGYPVIGGINISGVVAPINPVVPLQ